VSDAFQKLFEHLESFQGSSLPIIPSVTARRLREEIAHRFNPNVPRPLAELVGDVCSMLATGLTHSIHPRHFGLFNPTTHEASVIADALTAAYNPQLAVWQSAPAAVEIEQYVLSLFAHRMGWEPSRASMSFTSGGAEANHTAMALALARGIPGYITDGLAKSSIKPVVYTSAESHGSIVKAAQLTGIGRSAVRFVGVDRACRINLRTLKSLLETDRKSGFTPLMFVATVGTTSSGSIDPVRAMADVAAEEGAWFHVDAAWGAIAALSSHARTALDGIDRADSVTWDAHKTLPVAMGAGMFFCQFPDVVRALFEVDAPYMMRGDDDRVQPYLSSMQWSRRFIGLKVLLTLASNGWSGIERMVDRQFALADRLRTGLRAAGWEIVNETPLPVVCFTHPSARKDNSLIRKVVSHLWRSQLAWVSETRLASTVPCVRACITNVDTTEADVDALLEAVIHSLE
jgi:glutamate/tyrosine decarboxylase-like PLP-dependent enzyme